MTRQFLTFRCFAVVSMLVLAFAVGCGDDEGGSSGGEISVETGSLSKSEFIQRADAICKSTRERFSREYSAFARKSTGKSGGEEAVLGELIDTILLPNYERAIKEISALGAPRGGEEQISSFLTALQVRLDEIADEPKELVKNVTPLARPAKLAQSYGLSGCADSFG